MSLILIDCTPNRYGLIRLPKADAGKTQPKITKNIFESDSDDDSFVCLLCTNYLN